MNFIARPLPPRPFLEPGYEILVDGVSIGRLCRTAGCWFFNCDDKELQSYLFFEVAMNRRAGWKAGRDAVLKSLRKAYERRPVAREEA